MLKSDDWLRPNGQPGTTTSFQDKANLRIAMPGKGQEKQNQLLPGSQVKIIIRKITKFAGEGNPATEHLMECQGRSPRQ
ncbi:MAG: hypothetical protein ACYCOO_00445 [Chitinophagaceae bacterium]